MKIIILICVLLSQALIFAHADDIKKLVPEDGVSAISVYALRPLPQQLNEHIGRLFHEYPVLDEVTVTNHSGVTRILTALNVEFTAADSLRNRNHCAFAPAHGVSILYGAKQIDYLLCYNCGAIERFDGKNSAWQFVLKRSARQYGKSLRILLNSVLDEPKKGKLTTDTKKGLPGLRGLKTAKKSDLLSSDAQAIKRIREAVADHKLNATRHFKKSEYSEDDVVALGKIGSKAVPLLKEIITSYPSVVPRINALEALEMLRDKGVPVDGLIKKALKDSNLLVRQKAAHILVKVHDKEAIPVLINIALQKPNALDRDILEDGFYRPEFYVLYVYQTQGFKKAATINPNLKTVSQDHINGWAKDYAKLKESIITSAINDLENFNVPKVVKTLTSISTHGATENIKQSAVGALQEMKKEVDRKP